MFLVSLWWLNKPQNFYRDLSRKINPQFNFFPLLIFSGCFEPTQLLSWQQLMRKKEIREFHDTLCWQSCYNVVPPKFTCLLSVCICVCTRTFVCVCNGASVDTRMKTWGSWASLSTVWVLGMELDHQAWLQMLVLTEQSHWLQQNRINNKFCHSGN